MISSVPFWVWFALVRKIHEGGLHRTDRHGAPNLKKHSYQFGDRITLPQNYWDGGVWAMPGESVSADDTGNGRARLYVYLQSRRFGNSKALTVSRRWFPAGSGVEWRYQRLRTQFNLSAADARLVVSIEEGREYSKVALDTARHRERQEVARILARKAIHESILSLIEFKALRTMFPNSHRVVRFPLRFQLYGPWPTELEPVALKTSGVGEPYTLPQRPPVTGQLM